MDAPQAHVPPRATCAAAPIAPHPLELLAAHDPEPVRRVCTRAPCRCVCHPVHTLLLPHATHTHAAAQATHPWRLNGVCPRRVAARWDSYRASRAPVDEASRRSRLHSARHEGHARPCTARRLHTYTWVCGRRGKQASKQASTWASMVLGRAVTHTRGPAGASSYTRLACDGCLAVTAHMRRRRPRHSRMPSRICCAISGCRLSYSVSGSHTSRAAGFACRAAATKARHSAPAPPGSRRPRTHVGTSGKLGACGCGHGRLVDKPCACACRSMPCATHLLPRAYHRDDVGRGRDIRGVTDSSRIVALHSLVRSLPPALIAEELRAAG